ncbi:hypothetical protein SMD11_0077 [Streptomyces albireticuli]|uniref:Uncharacterized protein n=1 Tax=Streptomyces albireticuli TaxID=1940 RepID=A0A1Z2KUL5_9ACTN|nr:hypothetical protein [Streptomyces albireticuli]ARZ65744.1 hypothetical protein SMD11_0077 [Streptomyces albireticuli]
MTHERILAVCRSNWEYRGIDDASVREMLEELAHHLCDAEAAGRTARDVVGGDVRAFAASWARARAPLPRRALRTTALACSVLGCLLLFAHLIQWTAHLAVTADRVAFYAVLTAVTVVWETRRGSLGLGKSWALSLAVALPVLLLANRLAGDATLLTTPLWATALLLLPGLPYAVTDTRARKNTPATG